MSDTRKQNVSWKLPERLQTWEQANAAILMDLRDELQKLNRVFECYRFLRIPEELKQIRRNTTKRRRKTKR